ncbi:MAG: RNA polymerase factor sigma-54 [Epsilonproteobacteria bacterium]|nr:RNA polymerase factor sigma-54 [Campylobacterota bacterium]
MGLKQRLAPQTKTRLSTTLRSWLPILQAGLEELEERLKAYEEDNPYLQVRSGFETQAPERPAGRFERFENFRGGRTEVIEAVGIYEKSLYERLEEQIGAPLFPTPRSEKIARAILAWIGEEGYFEGDTAHIAKELGVTADEVEKIRLRFAYLEPSGVGARTPSEAMLFQLYQSEVAEPLFSTVEAMLKNFDALERFYDHPLYSEALGVIRRFKNPPALETMPASRPLVPDLIVEREGYGFTVKINDIFYPDIEIEDPGIDEAFVKKRLKEARDLIDALAMRKATLYKIGLMIVEFQYDFFAGGEIRPMKLKDIAEEFDHNPSTISRAIANKYLACDRGIFAMKSFFVAGLDEEVSNAAIKRFIAEVIEKEDRQKPLSDQKLLEMVQARFGVKMVRRTVTKYRKQMGIGSSGERKRLYRLA